MEDKNFFDYVNESYKDYGSTKDELIRAYCEYAKTNLHLEFERHIRDHFNHAFGGESWADHVNAKVISKKLSGEAREVLCQIVRSPKFDGDVISKSGKSELFSHGLILRICNSNNYGDNAANLLGWLVYKELYGKQ